jgi:hypothetical protein
MAYVPKGQYEARAIKPGKDDKFLGVLANDKKTEYLQLSFRIESGPYAGKVLTWKGFLSDKAHEFTVQALGYCGARMANGDFMDLEGVDSNVVQIVVDVSQFPDQRTGEVKEASQVQFVNPLSGKIKAENQADSSVVSRLRERCRAAALKAKGGGGSVPTSGGNDIPF